MTAITSVGFVAESVGFIAATAESAIAIAAAFK